MKNDNAYLKSPLGKPRSDKDKLLEESHSECSERTFADAQGGIKICAQSDETSLRTHRRISIINNKKAARVSGRLFIESVILFLQLRFLPPLPLRLSQPPHERVYRKHKEEYNRGSALRRKRMKRYRTPQRGTYRN